MVWASELVIDYILDSNVSSFYQKKGKKEFWKIGENLIFPLLCFSFVVTFIQTLVTGGDSSALWFNGVFAVGAAFGSFYNFVVKPKKDSL